MPTASSPDGRRRVPMPAPAMPWPSARTWDPERRSTARWRPSPTPTPTRTSVTSPPWPAPWPPATSSELEPAGVARKRPVVADEPALLLEDLQRPLHRDRAQASHAGPVGIVEEAD